MKKFLIIFISQILFGNANCQEYSDGVLRLLINDEKAIPTNELKTSSIMVNEILTKYNVKSYKQAMPWSEHELLKRVYLLEFEDQKSEQLIHELTNTLLYDFVGYEKKANSNL